LHELQGWSRVRVSEDPTNRLLSTGKGSIFSREESVRKSAYACPRGQRHEKKGRKLTIAHFGSNNDTQDCAVADQRPVGNSVKESRKIGANPERFEREDLPGPERNSDEKKTEESMD